MGTGGNPLRPSAIAIVFLSAAYFLTVPARAQVRGVYPLGMNATNSGVTPESGFTYSNVFLFYSRDQLVGPSGEVLGTGQNSVLMDMNSFIWVSKGTIGILGGPVFSLSATLPIANNSLTSNAQGALSGGGGFGDSYYQPVILGWRLKRVDVRAVCGFLAPTGRFNATANNNVGSGYWTSVPSAGQTFYLNKSKTTAVSAFEMYEFHGTQQGTNIHPGQTFDLANADRRGARRLSPSIWTCRLRSTTNHRQEWTDHHSGAGDSALQGKRARVRFERNVANAESDFGH